MMKGHRRRSQLRSGQPSPDHDEKKQFLNLNVDGNNYGIEIIDPAADLPAAQAQAAQLRALHSAVFNAAPHRSSNCSLMNRSQLDYPIFKLSREQQTSTDPSQTTSTTRVIIREGNATTNDAEGELPRQRLSNFSRTTSEEEDSECEARARLREERIKYVLDDGIRRSFKPPAAVLATGRGHGRQHRIIGEFSAAEESAHYNYSHISDHGNTNPAVSVSNYRKVRRSHSNLDMVWTSPQQFLHSNYSYDLHLLPSYGDYRDSGHVQQKMNVSYRDLQAAATGNKLRRSAANYSDHGLAANSNSSVINCGTSRRKLSHHVTIKPSVDAEMRLISAPKYSENHRSTEVNKQPVVINNKGAANPIIAWFNSRISTRMKSTSSTSAAAATANIDPVPHSGPLHVMANNGQVLQLGDHVRNGVTLTANSAEAEAAQAQRQVLEVRSAKAKEAETKTRPVQLLPPKEGEETLKEMKAAMAAMAQKLQSVEQNCARLQRKMSEMKAQQKQQLEDSDSDHEMMQELLRRSTTAGVDLDENRDESAAAALQRLFISDNGGPRSTHRCSGTLMDSNSRRPSSSSNLGLRRNLAAHYDVPQLAGADGLKSSAARIENAAFLQETVAEEMRSIRSDVAGETATVESLGQLEAADEKPDPDDSLTSYCCCHAHVASAFDEEYKEEFIRAVAEVRAAVKQLSRVFVEQVKEREGMEAMEAGAEHGDEEIEENGEGRHSHEFEFDRVMNEQLLRQEKEKISEKRRSSNIARAMMKRRQSTVPQSQAREAAVNVAASLWHVEASIHATLHEHFENVGFSKGGAHPLAEPGSRAADSRRCGWRLRRRTCDDLLSRASPRFDPRFHTFCSRKGEALGRSLGWPLATWTSDMLRSFASAARAMLILHHLCFGAPLPPSILRLPPGAPLDRRFMEVLEVDRHAATSGARHVAVMVMPGFILERNVVKAKVVAR